MTQRVIGIDILNDCVRAVQLVREKNNIHVEKAMAYPARRKSDDARGILLALTRRYGFDAKADIAVALDYRHVFFKKSTFTAEQWETYQAGDTTALHGSFPLPSLELIVQTCDEQETEEGHEAVLSASSGPYIRERIHPILEARLKPAVVDSEILAVVDATQQAYREAVTGTAIILYCEESHISLAITEKGRLRLIRNTSVSLPSVESGETTNEYLIQLLSEQIQMSWQRLRPDDGAINAHLYLVLDSPVAEDLAERLAHELDCPVESVEPGKGWSLAPGVQLDASLIVACGLAWRALNQTSVNFLSALPKGAQQRASLQHEVTICTLLVLACFVSWFGGMFMQMRSLKSTQAEIQQDIDQTFKEAVPGEPSVAPLAQLKQHLEGATSDQAYLQAYDPERPGVLSVLQVINDTLPTKSSIRVNDIVMTDDIIRLQGHCRDSQDLFDWKKTLKNHSCFKNVALWSTGLDPHNNLTTFKVNLEIASERP